LKLIRKREHSKPSQTTNPRIFVRFAGASMIALTIAGCAQQGGVAGMGSKETSGTAIGAAAGGIAGAFFGKGTGKIAAVLGGAVIGGLIGNRVGAALDDRDKQALAAKAQQALLTQPDNAPLPWASDHNTGVTGSVSATNTRIETKPVRIVRDANVAPAGQLDIIGAKYVAKSATKIRLAPTTDSDEVTTLAGGATIWAVGKVHGQPWIMVARGGKSIGYVTATNVIPAPTVASPAPVPAKPASAEPPAPAAAAAFDLDSAPPPVRTPADLDALGPTEKVDTVTASVSCRDLKTTVTANGQTSTDGQTACRSPDGAWQLD